MEGEEGESVCRGYCQWVYGRLCARYFLASCGGVLRFRSLCVRVFSHVFMCMHTVVCMIVRVCVCVCVCMYVCMCASLHVQVYSLVCVCLLIRGE